MNRWAIYQVLVLCYLDTTFEVHYTLLRVGKKINVNSELKFSPDFQTWTLLLSDWSLQLLPWLETLLNKIKSLQMLTVLLEMVR